MAVGSPAADVNLPDIGSPADAVLSKNDEAQLGRAIMRQIHASGEIVEDPQVTEYINEIGHRLAARARRPVAELQLIPTALRERRV